MHAIAFWMIVLSHSRAASQQGKCMLDCKSLTLVGPNEGNTNIDCSCRSAIPMLNAQGQTDASFSRCGMFNHACTLVNDCLGHCVIPYIFPRLKLILCGASAPTTQTKKMTAHNGKHICSARVNLSKRVQCRKEYP